MNSTILISKVTKHKMNLNKAVILLYERVERIFRSGSGSPDRPQEAPFIGGYRFISTYRSNMWL